MKRFYALTLLALLACSPMAFAEDSASAMGGGMPGKSMAMEKDKMMEKPDAMKNDAKMKNDTMKKEVMDKGMEKSDGMAKDGMAPANAMSK